MLNDGGPQIPASMLPMAMTDVVNWLSDSTNVRDTSLLLGICVGIVSALTVPRHKTYTTCIPTSTASEVQNHEDRLSKQEGHDDTSEDTLFQPTTSQQLSIVSLLFVGFTSWLEAQEHNRIGGLRNHSPNDGSNNREVHSILREAVHRLSEL